MEKNGSDDRYLDVDIIDEVADFLMTNMRLGALCWEIWSRRVNNI